MHNFVMISAEELAKECDLNTLEELKELARAPDAMCSNCKAEKAWRYGQTGMCFSCTTGEADASGDYELIPE